MKKIFLVLLACVLVNACQKKEEISHSTEIVTLVDITDRHLLLPAARSIQKLYQFDDDENKEAFFRICPISDKHLNPAVEFRLANTSVTEKNNSQDDPDFRGKNIVTFYSKIEKAITDFDNKCHLDSSLGKSECFATIAGEIQQMKKNNFEKDIILIFSDLQENSDMFRSYFKANQELLRKNPGKVVALFNSFHLLPDDLWGFKIFFVYEPKNREDDQRFGAMMTIYSKLLETRGLL